MTMHSRQERHAAARRRRADGGGGADGLGAESEAADSDPAGEIRGWFRGPRNRGPCSRAAGFSHAVRYYDGRTPALGSARRPGRDAVAACQWAPATVTPRPRTARPVAGRSLLAPRASVASLWRNDRNGSPGLPGYYS